MEKLKNVKAILFDLDGTLTDTEKLWLDLTKVIIEEMHLNLPHSVIYDNIGRRSNEIKEILIEYLGTNIATKFLKRYTELSNEYIKKNGMPIKTGAIEILKFAKENGYITALASSSYKANILQYLKSAKIDDKLFDNIIGGDMVVNAKPNPEIYLRTLNELQLTPQECIVIEDSNYGVEAGYKAGLRVIFIQDIKPLTKHTQPMIYKQVNSLLDVIELLK